mgnify:CR=1 FL=1
MTAFRYRAVNLEGREIQGVVDADTSRQARGVLRQQGLIALAVNVAGRPVRAKMDAWESAPSACVTPI